MRSSHLEVEHEERYRNQQNFCVYYSFFGKQAGKRQTYEMGQLNFRLCVALYCRALIFVRLQETASTQKCPTAIR